MSVRKALTSALCVAWAISCGLNPQPEPPAALSDDEASGSGGAAQFHGGAGGRTAGDFSDPSSPGGAPMDMTPGPGPSGTGGLPTGAGGTFGTAGAGGTVLVPALDAGLPPAIDAGRPDAQPTGDAMPADGGDCQSGGASSLPGVAIRFPEQPCVFSLSEIAAGVSFHYEVVVGADIGGVITEPQDAGRCGLKSPGGLDVLEGVSGLGQSYCICDVGLCAPGASEPITLLAGTYEASFDWDGRNWSGPSDTGNPKGASFPAGTYWVTVRGIGQLEGDGGTRSYAVEGTLQIELVP